MITRYVALLNQDFFLCFSPERVDPGNPTWHTHNTPKVIGGITPACLEAGLAAYERFLKTKLTRIENVASIESSFALKQVKYTNSLPLETLGG